MAVACSWAKSIRPPIIAALRIGAEAQDTRDSNLSIGVTYIAHLIENIGTGLEFGSYQAGLSS
jgi:hypothetical protein